MSPRRLVLVGLLLLIAAPVVWLAVRSSDPHPYAPVPDPGLPVSAGGELAGSAPAPADAPRPQRRAVTINRAPLSDAQVEQLERQYGIRVADGDYWYDARVGAWGLWGGPALGLAVPGLAVGGPLGADASGGGTGVFFNGRELHPLDVVALRQVTGVVLPGRYWLDAAGWGGYEGGPAFFNLWALAAQAQAAGGGGGGSWIHRGPGGGMGGDGDCVYYISGDASAMAGC